MLRRNPPVPSSPARSRARSLFKLTSAVALALVLAGGCSSPVAPSSSENIGTTAQAESSDTFGLGEGRSGALSVTAPGTIINTYAPITFVDTTLTKITVGALHGATTTLSPGDLLLVWRTTGLTAVSGSQSAFNLSVDVGGYEFARVKSVSGSVVTVTNPLGSATRYTTGSQVIRVPEYTTVNVAAAGGIVPYAWDGSSGGAVIFLATGGVTNAGTIAADGSGFRGGAVEQATAATANPGCTGRDGSDEEVPCGGAHKGEGLDPNAYAIPLATSGGNPHATYGDGNYANGGGGGEARNAGGGGGGHAGQGGAGGNTALSDGSRAVGGFGGAAVTYDASTTFFSMGGGGGAGDEDHMSATPGGAGGGVIFVRAASMTGSGSYSAEGASVPSVVGTDGGGGGGAGGAIVLYSTGGVACMSASVNGGVGGSGGSEPDGPGGGGGGGVIFIESASTTCTLTQTGGANGSTTSTTTPGAYGATAGANGQVTPGGGGLAYGGGPCTPAVVGANQCGGCVLDADCGMGAVCDTAKKTCGPCNATEQGSCTGVTSACSTIGANDTCVACNGDFGSTATAPCLSASLATCVTTGLAAGTCGACLTGADCKTPTAPACSSATSTCAPCNGDNGTAATAICPTTTSPYCQTAGTCGVCTADSDCAGNHAGPRCDVNTGACGNTCSTDAICGVGQWCDNLAGQGICQDRVANGSAVPGGTCTSAIGARACISGACDTTDNECGLVNGAACSSGDAGTGASQCRSGVCPSSGPKASTCEPCASDGDCSVPGMGACSPTTNACVACTATNATACTGNSPLCNATSNTCVACNGDVGTKNTFDCTSSTAPFCLVAGACGKCTSNADCTGSVHAGLVCDLTSGACGSTCTTSSECGSGFWCTATDAGTGSCKAQLANGASLPTSPAGLATCTAAVGAEVCSSGVCNTKENTCGPATDGGAAHVDAGNGFQGDGSIAGAAVSVEGGACDVRGARGRPGSSGFGADACFVGIALAGMSIARRRRSVGRAS